MSIDLSKVHPDLRSLASKLPSLSYNRGTIKVMRFLTHFQPHFPPPQNVQVHNIKIPGQDLAHRVLLRIYQPKFSPAPVPGLVWMHGGGFVIGFPEMIDAFLCQLVQELGIVVVSVDYRLAPDHPFPAPLEDCYTALKWTADQAGQLGIDPDRIGVGGESAGGGLAASLAQLAHDRGEVHTVFQMLVYPMLDDRTCVRSGVDEEEHLLWNPANNRFGWQAYLRQAPGGKTVPAYAAAARRKDLSGLPPAWIGVGDLDLFYQEDVDYAERLQASGVDCELLILPGVFHGFDFTDTRLPVVRSFRTDQIEALARGLGIERGKT